MCNIIIVIVVVGDAFLLADLRELRHKALGIEIHISGAQHITCAIVVLQLMVMLLLLL